MMEKTLEYGGGMDRDKPEVLLGALQALLKSFPDMIFVKDMDLTYVAGTQSFAEMLGKSSMEEVLGRTDYELFEDKSFAGRYTADDRRLLADGRDMVDYIEPLTDEDGQARYSSTSKYILSGADGAPVGILGISRDITRQMKAQKQYQQEIEYLFTLPEDTYAAVFIDVTNWRIAAQRRQELGPGQYVPLFDTMETFLRVAQEDVEDLSCEACRFYREFSREKLLEIYEQGRSSLALEYQRRLSDGEGYWIRDELRFMTDPMTGHLGLVLLVRDIDSKKQAEEDLAQAATTDEMTGLLNRVTTRRLIREFLEGAGAQGTHALFMIDVDNFKTVNDTYGHHEGDVLLTRLAHGIKSCFRETDVVGRIGGDEFFVLAKNMPGRDVIQSKAERLLSVMRELHATQTTALTSVSIGISIYPKDGKGMDELYEKADEALYRAKGLGKNQAAFASDEQTLWSSNAFALRYEAYNSQVVDHSNSICYISDMETYDLLHLTKAGMELYGLTTPEEYLGKKCHQVIMGLDEPCPFCTNAMLREGQEYRWEFYNKKIGRWFDRTSSIIQLDGRPRHLEIGRDITARKEEISLLSGQLTMEDVLFRCLHTLTNEQDMDTAVNLFLEAVGGFYQANRAYIFEFDLEAGLIDNTFEWCMEGVTAEIDHLQRLPIEVVADWIRKFESDGEFSINSLHRDRELDSDEYRILAAQGIESLMTVPLRQHGEIVGFLGVDDPRQNQGNMTLLRSVSDFVLAELERRRLMSELERMSYIDTLTGLQNRNQYDRLLQEYEQGMPDSLGIILVDINGIKGLNMVQGRSVGDRFIQRVGRILTGQVTGTVFRTGGDEFAALRENISREDFRQECDALREAFREIEECSVALGFAWGEGEKSTRNLLRQAGEMLLREKVDFYRRGE